MKRIVITLLLLLVPTLVSAQTHFELDFSGAYPPSGWTIDAHAINWSAKGSDNAGGTAPELEFSWSPSFVGMSHFISPEVDLTGITLLKFDKHLYNYPQIHHQKLLPLLFFYYLKVIY